LKSVGRLQDQTSVLLATFLLEEGGTGSRFEDFADTFVGLGRAFEILVCADLLANFLTLFRSHGLLRSLVQLFNGLLVVAEIFLAADKDYGETLTEVKNLRDPLFCDDRSALLSIQANIARWESGPFLGRCQGNLGSRRRSR